MASIGLTGMNGAQKMLEAASHNLVNEQTPGFKEFRVLMEDIYSGTGSGSVVNMAGTAVSATPQLFSQGQLTNTGNRYDLGIDGTGFFAVNDQGKTFYTRAGSFQIDKDKHLINEDGYTLQGYAADDKGNILLKGIADMKASANVSPGAATTNAEADLNLDAEAEVIVPSFDSKDPSTYNWYSSTDVFDSLGSKHLLSVYYIKKGQNEWDMKFEVDGAATTVSKAPASWKFTRDGVLDVQQVSDPVVEITQSLTSGANDLDLRINFAGITQYVTDYRLNSMSIDGHMSGLLTDISVANNGVLEAHYSNGRRQVLGQVAVATFSNQEGLGVYGNNTWIETNDSGVPLYSQPGANDAGDVKSGVLEESTVEASRTLANIMQAQRNFQMSAKIFSTENSLTQSLINLIS